MQRMNRRKIKVERSNKGMHGEKKKIFLTIHLLLNKGTASSIHYLTFNSERIGVGRMTIK